MTSVRTTWIVAAITLAACLRIYLLVTYADLADPHLWEFGRIARNIVESGTFSYYTPGVPTAYIPPAYPLLIAGLYTLFGIGLTAHALLGAMLLLVEIAIPFLVAGVTVRIFGRRAGLVALLSSLFWPRFLIISGRLHDVPISMALLLLVFWLLLAPSGKGMKKAVLCGATLGLLGNFRFEAILFSLPIGYYLHRVEARSLLATLRLVSVLLLSFAILMAPWTVRNYYTFDRFVLGTSGAYNLLRGHNENASGTGRDAWPAAKIDPDRATPLPGDAFLDSLNYSVPADELAAGDRYFELAIRHMLDHPGRELKLLGLKTYYFLCADFTHPTARFWPIWLPSLAALLVGLQHWMRQGLGDPRQQILWMIFFLQMALMLLLFVLPRYRIAVDFVPVVFASSWLANRPDLKHIRAPK
ncbi:MAG: hypothetical protein CME06_04335 [Gemmatimonadetes bacterium]|nr:hypothetical protein [Gemmatimonadota bacterium]